MGQITKLRINPNLNYLGFTDNAEIRYQLLPEELVEHAIYRAEGCLTDDFVLSVDTGKFTGRSPKDRYIVDDHLTKNRVAWGEINIKFSAEAFNQLYTKVINYLDEKVIFVTDGTACADVKHQLTIRTITETAYQNLFAYNLFIALDKETSLNPEWTIIAAPGFEANPEEDGTSNKNFTIINFSRRIILIGGTGYTGEIKKGIFSVLNFILPQRNILPMHCAANMGKDGDTAIFFGLSGTGKTTLSADPERSLIGDDEHGWSDGLIFNFEGGCYAKAYGLTPEKEPEICNALRPGALLENVRFFPFSRTVDFNDISVTENTRISYPLHYISNAVKPSIGPAPKNIFFLTADAFGVLPPVAKLTRKQAMYYFLSGYTAKVAGTEFGINEPKVTFSACFGKVFLPLDPVIYANLLGEKLDENPVNVWLINTGWIGGSYGSGERINLKYTRAIITAAIKGNLSEVKYETIPIFNLMVPVLCPGVPSEILNPLNNWADQYKYMETAKHLAQLFRDNCSQFAHLQEISICETGPEILA